MSRCLARMNAASVRGARRRSGVRRVSTPDGRKAEEPAGQVSAPNALNRSGRRLADVGGNAHPFLVDLGLVDRCRLDVVEDLAGTLRPELIEERWLRGGLGKLFAPRVQGRARSCGLLVIALFVVDRVTRSGSAVRPARGTRFVTGAGPSATQDRPSAGGAAPSAPSRERCAARRTHSRCPNPGSILCGWQPMARPQFRSSPTSASCARRRASDGRRTSSCSSTLSTSSPSHSCRITCSPTSPGAVPPRPPSCSSPSTGPGTTRRGWPTGSTPRCRRCGWCSCS